uniref:Uncharacterized protein n=1 Tax=Pipistrellus kuhlii TaxID=59472 RepID=A0A7J8A810_PIPKU|nr:hypothetical protein mPipKuh1_009053 [Pipistrellus kuhlii]
MASIPIAAAEMVPMSSHTSTSAAAEFYIIVNTFIIPLVFMTTAIVATHPNHRKLCTTIHSHHPVTTLYSVCLYPPTVHANLMPNLQVERGGCWEGRGPLEAQRSGMLVPMTEMAQSLPPDTPRTGTGQERPWLDEVEKNLEPTTMKKTSGSAFTSGI